MSKNLKVKLISTTNDKFKHYEGCTGLLTFSMSGCFYFDMIKNFLRSSALVDKVETKSGITFNTLNSIYVFEKLDEIQLDDIFKSEEKEEK